LQRQVENNKAQKKKNPSTTFRRYSLGLFKADHDTLNNFLQLKKKNPTILG